MKVIASPFLGISLFGLTCCRLTVDKAQADSAPIVIKHVYSNLCIGVSADWGPGHFWHTMLVSCTDPFTQWSFSDDGSIMNTHFLTCLGAQNAVQEGQHPPDRFQVFLVSCHASAWATWTYTKGKLRNDFLKLCATSWSPAGTRIGVNDCNWPNQTGATTLGKFRVHRHNGL
jgi:hypothetical protein